jgi:hypothetical protein
VNRRRDSFSQPLIFSHYAGILYWEFPIGDVNKPHPFPDSFLYLISMNEPEIDLHSIHFPIELLEFSFIWYKMATNHFLPSEEPCLS